MHLGTGRCLYGPSVENTIIGGARRASVAVAGAECLEGAGSGLENESARAGTPETTHFSDAHAGIEESSQAAGLKPREITRPECGPRLSVLSFRMESIGTRLPTVRQSIFPGAAGPTSHGRPAMANHDINLQGTGRTPKKCLQR